MLKENKPDKNTPTAIIKELSEEERARLIQEEKEKIERDEKSKLVYAYEKGFKKGYKEGWEEVFKNCLDTGNVEVINMLQDMGYDMKTMTQSTGLTSEQIKQFSKEC